MLVQLYRDANVILPFCKAAWALGVGGGGSRDVRKCMGICNDRDIFVIEFKI